MDSQPEDLLNRSQFRSMKVSLLETGAFFWLIPRLVHHLRMRYLTTQADLYQISLQNVPILLERKLGLKKIHNLEESPLPSDLYHSTIMLWCTILYSTPPPLSPDRRASFPSPACRQCRGVQDCCSGTTPVELV